ncbi:FAD-dependent oxidoreductase [Microlunatus speluncae]|uniref:FAD-dependent oxidoreductase n=1 Tax=Microlunatus speluncae TaxID=2594267 RepID=UPI0012663036|nr:FAD-dependent oxidoreductase [Microlunatus speluncae]
MRPFVVAIIGSGPSGIYAAEALCQQSDVAVSVAVLDRLPVPFGLVRYGVAPDHPSIRSIRNTLERTLSRPEVRFYGDVTVGRDVTIDELRGSVDAVIYAYGAASDRRLDIPGEDLDGSIAAAELVAWYCGHPDVHPDLESPAITGPEPAGIDAEQASRLVASTRSAVVVGVGNVALDVVRILIRPTADLARTDMAEEVLTALDDRAVTDVHVLGRRGPANTSFTTKELRELGDLDGVDIVIDPFDHAIDPATIGKVAARNLAVLSGWAERSDGTAARRIHFHFWTRPVRLAGEGRVASVITERTMIDSTGRLLSAGPGPELPADLVVRSVGYRGTALPGVPYDPEIARVPHAEGRVIRDGSFATGEYVTGWIKRGPTGVIGTNKSDAVETVTSLLTDIADGELVADHDRDDLDRLLADRGIHPLGMPAWRLIDAAEIERGHRQGRDRATLAHRSDLLAAAADPDPDPPD